MKHLYTEQDWEEWSNDERTNYKSVNWEEKQRNVYVQKGYLHFDPRFWFPERSHEVQEIVSAPQAMRKWQFYPFIQIIAETKRFKYDAQEGRATRSTKKRPICFAAHKDALIYGFYSHCLTKRYQSFIESEGFADSVSAYRTDLNGACNIQFAKEVFDYIKQAGECTAIALDIKGFFDHLDHELLKQRWARVIGEERLPDDQYKLFRTLTRFAFVDQGELMEYLNVDLKKVSRFPKSILDLFPKGQHAGLFRQLRKRNIIKIQEEIGIPQGSPISAVLSNIYMIDFDSQLSQLSQTKGFLYKRYCDDILIVCPMELAVEIKQTVYDAIINSKLIIQPEKEEEILFKYDFKRKLRGFNAKYLSKRLHKFLPGREHYYYKPLQYLGFEFDGQDVLIRNSSICRFHKKMQRRVTKSVRMAYSPNGLSDKVFTQTTYQRYSHLGKRNFLTYAYRCAAKTYTNNKGDIKQGMDSPKIRSQVSRHMRQLKSTLTQKSSKRYIEKLNKGKRTVYKRL